MIHLDGRLPGSWNSAPIGVMETTDLYFLPDGRGWSRYESISKALDIGRFRWHCTDARLLVLRYTWRVHGEWATDPDGFAVVHHSRPDDEVIETGYRVMPQPSPVSGATGTALLLDEHVDFETTFYRGRDAVTPADDPSAAFLPYRPTPRPAPPRPAAPRPAR
ncbi:hypothetical protein [Streptomyces sp. NRRL S-87]|uniref:hypothetical protein n=1 Tax=Streptomyces sp. NRRL S-87 TaxID=1463920 RepID=UPI0004BF97F2|nr:hypothetical protein [Streptomyces sp. NRRL S-87]